MWTLGPRELPFTSTAARTGHSRPSGTGGGGGGDSFFGLTGNNSDTPACETVAVADKALSASALIPR
jgi:hypothetical protein